MAFQRFRIFEKFIDAYYIRQTDAFNKLLTKHANDQPHLDLSDEEKNFALTHARNILGEYLKTGKYSEPIENIPDKFREKASVDVTLWVRGSVRGSFVVQNMPLIIAIEKSTIRSCRDRRFKPIAIEELDSTIIEIAVFSGRRMPLLNSEIRANTIATEKGYMLSVRGRKGWFLPAVFNCITFKNLNDFLTRLIEEKAGVSKALLSKATIETFEVNNFIESAHLPRTALSLRGPVVRNDFVSDIDTIATRGADYLCRIQEADGNIPPIINPLTGEKTQIDWIRLAFTAWSLALFGKVYKNQEYIKTAGKAFKYVINNAYTHPYIRDDTRCLLFVYAYKLANVLGEFVEAKRIHKEILGMLPKLSYEPILYSQIALHLLESGNELAKAEEFSNSIFKDYEQRVSNGNFIELVRFAELIPKSEAISEWYVSQQLPDGSFPKVAGSRFAHTRGTAKIFEVLCLEPEKNKACIECVIGWLSEMQYDENNMYFVREDIRREIIGGFRHDYMNQAVWIDAVGHVLLGAARLAKNEGS